jgi:hypothetical protein
MLFTDAQARYLLATFKCMDKNLASALRAIGGEPDAQGLVREYETDATVSQRDALKHKIADLREALRDFIDRHRLPVAAPASGLFAFRATLSFLRVSIEEIGPRGLAGFGDVTPEGAAEIDELSRRLNQLVTDMADICRDGTCQNEKTRARRSHPSPSL